ncbi:hypothetical protein TcCL_ESM03471 [Trypanosoma cruzi]|nr:hypothetical protein TcCL_ESM03471 [Trypanosoma cruzi]
MALSPSLSRGHHRNSSRTRNNNKKQKKGRWCGGPRCCRHCRHEKLCHVFCCLWLALLRILHSEIPYRIFWLMQLHHRNSCRVVWRLQWIVGSDDCWLKCLLCQCQTARL